MPKVLKIKNKMEEYMNFENEGVDPIKLVYEERRAANVDSDEEIAILRACGYKVPETNEGMNELAVKMLNFLDTLTEKQKFKIKENAKTISKRRKILRESGIKDNQFQELEFQTPLELLSEQSKHKLNLFESILECKYEDKEILLETVDMGFDILNDSIDNIENTVLGLK
jgi:hypothetical protein